MRGIFYSILVLLPVLYDCMEAAIAATRGAGLTTAAECLIPEKADSFPHMIEAPQQECNNPHPINPKSRSSIEILIGAFFVPHEHITHIATTAALIPQTRPSYYTQHDNLKAHDEVWNPRIACSHGVIRQCLCSCCEACLRSWLIGTQCQVQHNGRNLGQVPGRKACFDQFL